MIKTASIEVALALGSGRLACSPWTMRSLLVVEIIADINLRNHFGLQDSDVVEISVPTIGIQ
jgi:CTP-dependent riboflavin kinase